MTDAQARKAAKEFAAYWKDKGYEKGESQPFWLSLLRSVLGVEEPEKFIRFEDQVHLDNTSFIDGMIDETHVMIEQKSSGKSLMKPIRQSDGTLLTPFQQAKRYSAELPYSERPRWREQSKNAGNPKGGAEKKKEGSSHTGRTGFSEGLRRIRS